jgi:hypothetical protein
MKRDQRIDVNDSWRDAGRIDHLIQGLPEKHVPRRTPQAYVDGFVDAALDVYGRARVAQILQRRFRIPDAAQYSDQGFFRERFRTEHRYVPEAEGGGAAIRKRARSAGFPVGCHTWRATDVTVYFEERRSARAYPADGCGQHRFSWSLRLAH